MDLAWLANYPLLTVAANLTGVVGFALAIFFYFRSKEKVVLRYNIAEKLLIQPSTKLPFDMDVPLSWNGKQLTRLTRSFILVSNTGNRLVERSDIVGVSSLQVAGTSEIINAEIVFSDDPGSQAAVNSGSGNLRSFDFEFLRPRDSFIIKVDHTGALNEIFPECKTKAGGPIKKSNQRAKIISWSVFAVLIIGCLGNVIWRNSEVFPEDYSYNSKYNDVVNYIYGSFMIGFVVVLAMLIVGGLIGAVLSYVVRRGTKDTKRAWLVFIEISNNSKSALP
jgi:hypothetical protein